MQACNSQTYININDDANFIIFISIVFLKLQLWEDFKQVLGIDQNEAEKLGHNLALTLERVYKQIPENKRQKV